MRSRTEHNQMALPLDGAALFQLDPIDEKQLSFVLNAIVAALDRQLGAVELLGWTGEGDKK